MGSAVGRRRLGALACALLYKWVGYAMAEEQEPSKSKSKSKMVDRKGGKAVAMACDQVVWACALRGVSLVVVVVVAVIRS